MYILPKVWETVLRRVLLFRSEVKEGLVLAEVWSMPEQSLDEAAGILEKTGRGMSQNPTLMEKHSGRWYQKKLLFTLLYFKTCRHLWYKCEATHRSLRKRKIWRTKHKNQFLRLNFKSLKLKSWNLVSAYLNCEVKHKTWQLKRGRTLGSNSGSVFVAPYNSGKMQGTISGLTCLFCHSKVAAKRYVEHLGKLVSLG